ncbi:MAG: hypothetical protein HQ528_08110 [Candidatus Marinimicrobia bacterium]|nr:hypothetical protein [Candidatus Neomarinimicrobiota bacterium]
MISSYKILINPVLGILFGLFLAEISAQPSASPILYHVPPIEAKDNEDLEITVGLLQDISVVDVTLFYRTAHSSSYHEKLMNYRGGVWKGIIPAQELSPEGLEYLIVLRSLNTEYYATPSENPFETPHFVPVIPAGVGGRYFPGSNKIAATQMVDADILILSPQPGELLNPEDVVVALSLFNAPNIDTSSVKIVIDGDDYSAAAFISPEIISLHPEEILPGLHSVTISMATVYGMNVKPVIWSFGTTTGHINIDEQITYSGEVSSRISSDRIEGQVLNVGELTAKAEAGVSWVKAKAVVRITSRESEYLQPMNRYSTDISIGDYLTINAGDFFPTHAAMVLDGKRIRGVGVDLNLPWLRFQAASGIINRAVQHRNRIDEGYYLADVILDSTGHYTYQLERTGYTFTRKLSAYRLSVKFLSRYQIGLSLLKSKDVINSVDKLVSGATFTIDSSSTDGLSSIPYGNYQYDQFRSALSTYGGTLEFADKNWSGNKPAENIVVGFEYSSSHDNQRLRINANWNFSLENQDIWDGTMSRTQMDTMLDDSLDGLIGVSYDQYGLVVGSPIMIDTSKIPDPLKYSQFLTINIHMVPLLPLDYTAFEKRPIRSIMNMPSTAYNIRVRGYYYKNNLSAEYRQTGPVYKSYGNPYMMNNVREFILSDRVLMLDNKLLVNSSYKYQSNNILATTVNPIRTGTLLANVTLAPGPQVPSFTMNFQSITKNNATTDLDTINGQLIDQRESTLTRNSLLSVNFPFITKSVNNNLVINRYQVNNFDLLAEERQYNSVFSGTDSRSTSLSLSSYFTDIALKTVINLSQTEVQTSYAVNNWTVIGIQATYPLLEEKAQMTVALNYLKSSGYTSINVYNNQLGFDYKILDNLMLNCTTLIQLSQSSDWKTDGIDNDNNGKTDEFLESIEINSSTFNLAINYRF